ncbi:MAG TPA: alcohol dehydrogenase-like regulatory protein ErcA [Armatimonadota bacterium]|jgi:alcohol dehydrogenase class IV
MHRKPRDDHEWELRKFVAPEFVFGTGARHLAGQYAKNFGARKVLVVSDSGVIRAGWTGEVISSLEDKKLPHTVFSAITANPKDHEVMAGAALFHAANCDSIVAIGGGSAMDCAKGIGIVSTSNRHILEFKGVDEVAFPTPPLICIPTTAGSSADVSQFAIITDTQRNLKIAIASKAIVPDVALIDPETLTTMYPELTADTGMDAFVHAVEAYVSNAHSPVTDLFALESIQLLTEYLAAAKDDPENVELRGKTMLASLDAGLAFSNASLGMVHAMAHSLGGFLGTSHGENNAALLPHVMAFNFDAVPGRYRTIGAAMGLDMEHSSDDQAKSMLVERVNRLAKSVGLDITIGHLGVRPQDIPLLAENAMNDPCMVTNPRRPSRHEVEALYEQAL